jgi:hypothetical protein
MYRHKIARRGGFSRVELLLMLFIGVITLGMLTSCIQRVRISPARTQTVNNLKQMALACHSAHDVYKRLPPAFDKFAGMQFPAAVHTYCLLSNRITCTRLTSRRMARETRPTR